MLRGGAAAVSAREAFLLRELHGLFEADGLLTPAEDIVVVAARLASPDDRRDSASVCQVGRTFRPSIERIGFSTDKAIQPEFPRIEQRIPELSFGPEALAGSDPPFAARTRTLVQRAIATPSRLAGEILQVFLLSAPDASATLRLPQPIAHHHVPDSERAWTRF